MFTAIVMTDVEDEETEICQLQLEVLPNVGHTLWLSGSLRQPAVIDYGTAAFEIETVCHWVGHLPNTQKICLYVKPLHADEAPVKTEASA